MTILEFCGLNTDRQLDIINDLGKRLSFRLDEAHQITLYQMFDFHVELYFNRQQSRIKNIVAFQGIPIADAYADNADLPPVKPPVVPQQPPAPPLQKDV